MMIRLILLTLFLQGNNYFYCNGNEDSSLSLVNLDTFQLNPINESLVKSCCDHGQDFATKSAFIFEKSQCSPVKTDNDQHLNEVCSTIFQSCCEDSLKKRVCTLGTDTAMDHPPMMKRLWNMNSLDDVKSSIDYCKPNYEKITSNDLIEQSENCCLCRQVERQVVSEENVQLQRILWRFCKRIGCCPEYRMRETIKRLASIKYYNRPARDALIDDNIIRTDKSIKCQDQFIWDPNEGICVKMVIKCPIGMKMDRENNKCSYRTPEDVNCEEGYEYDEESEKCVDIDECTRYKLSDLCVAAGTDCRNTLGSYKCDCRDGFQRVNETTCIDIDECKLGIDDCTSGHACINTIGSYRCQRKVPCGYGYTLNENTQECEDIDECVAYENICGKNMICKNMRGSYYCASKKCPPKMKLNHHKTGVIQRDGDIFRPSSRRDSSGNCAECEKGYRQEESTKECIDIDECVEGTANCRLNEICVNEPGRFFCQPKLVCPTGTVLNEDGTNCADFNECINNSFVCESNEICYNRHGSYDCLPTPCHFPNMMYNYETLKCDCKPGFRLENGQCVDINECQEKTSPICPKEHTCQNTLGGFHCVSNFDCDIGYQRLSRDNDCTDIDECLINTHDCGTNMICINKPGSYECKCNKGLIKNSTNSCIDIDECALYNDKELCPDEKSKCVNTVGSYECVCPQGLKFVPSPVNRCQDEDECAINPKICGKFHKCINLSGSYLCECAPGFRHGSSDRECIDIDECVEGRSINETNFPTCPNGVCVNTPGSFDCRCPTGFKLDLVGNCQDINECDETIGACPNQPQPSCINLQGSYRCVSGSCPENYEKHKFINGFKCQLPRDQMCNPNDSGCHQNYPIQLDKIYFELKSNLQVPQILRRINPIKLKPGGKIRADVREHYSYNYETKAPVNVKDSFRLQMSRTQKGKIELVLVKEIPGAVDILISVYIMEDEKVVTDTRLYMFVTDSVKDRIKKDNERNNKTKLQYTRRLFRRRT